ncbi:MAG: T9SS type A sorting domain-containing protein [Bacteroidales bacterium]|nr:T9SS type A sorting domain-containing protein [Bacteroidales bacterium]
MKNFLAFIFLVFFSNILSGQFDFANTIYLYGTMPNNVGENDLNIAYGNWKEDFLESCSEGRLRVKFDDPAFTVSEGIAYGLLLSAYANDQGVFDSLWAYYEYFMNDNGVMNWKIEGCDDIVGFNGATDAELDATVALMVAELRWGNDGNVDYGSEADSLITAIQEYEVEDGTYVLKPGDAWGGANTTNPSYFATGYFRAYGDYTGNNDFWNNVADTSYAVIDNNLTVNEAVYNLVSDWCSADGSYSAEVSGWAYDQGRSYYYDAARTPWRIAVDYLWYGNSDALAYTNKCDSFVMEQGGISQVYPGYHQDGTAINTGYKDVVFTGAFAVASMASGDQTTINQGYTQVKSMVSSAYFGATLRVLYMFIMTGNGFNPTQEDVLSDNSFSEFSPSVIIYPNPASDNITIEITEGINNGLLQIIDMEGKIIDTFHIKRSVTQIPVGNLSKGVYCLVYSKRNGTYTEKIIIE